METELKNIRILFAMHKAIIQYLIILAPDLPFSDLDFPSAPEMTTTIEFVSRLYTDADFALRDVIGEHQKAMEDARVEEDLHSTLQDRLRGGLANWQRHLYQIKHDWSLNN